MSHYCCCLLLCFPLPVLRLSWLRLSPQTLILVRVRTVLGLGLIPVRVLLGTAAVTVIRVLPGRGLIHGLAEVGVSIVNIVGRSPLGAIPIRIRRTRTQRTTTSRTITADPTGTIMRPPTATPRIPTANATVTLPTSTAPATTPATTGASLHPATKLTSLHPTARNPLPQPVRQLSR